MYKAVLKRLFMRKTKSNKYDYGHVLVIGGSAGMVGAPLLAAEAALRVGAGLVTVASTSAVIDKLERRVAEVMTFRLSEESVIAAREILSFIRDHKVTTVVVGPGMSATRADLVKKLIGSVELPIIIDGGAFAALAHDSSKSKVSGSMSVSALQKRPSRQDIILTPHDGEFKKISAVVVPTTAPERKQIAQTFAKTNQLTLVLKGPRTIVARPSGALYENETGNPGLATAGSGDVLSGVIAGLAAQGIVAPEAAEVGVFIHGLAGDLAAKTNTQPGVIASDVIEYLPAALSGLLQFIG